MSCLCTFDSPIDLEKIRNSGQVFRLNKLSDNLYEYGHIQMSQVDEFSIRSTTDVTDLFDKSTDYNKLNDLILAHGNQYLIDAMTFSKGIRIMRQPLWEVIVTFMISQNNNIPNIHRCIDKLCANKEFPTNDQLRKLSIDDWYDLGAGYRSQYLYELYQRYDEIIQDLTLHPSEYHDILMDIRGIGPKVANCIELYGFHVLNAFPVDRWITRVLNREFNGTIDLRWCSDYKGIVQQYIFYYERYGYGK